MKEIGGGCARWSDRTPAAGMKGRKGTGFVEGGSTGDCVVKRDSGGEDDNFEGNVDVRRVDT